jgi:hypothetical protein
MKPLRRPGFFIGVICLLVGVGLTIGGLIMGHFLDEFGLILNPMTPQGLVWLTIGLAGFLHYFYGQRRLNRLKNEGLEYDAEVVDMTQSLAPMVRVGGVNRYSNGRVDCVYTNERGESCLVRSRYYMLSSFDGMWNLKAKVYADRNDPKDYEVELFRNIPEIRADRDYR